MRDSWRLNDRHRAYVGFTRNAGQLKFARRQIQTERQP